MYAFFILLWGLMYSLPLVIVAWILEALFFRRLMDSPIWGWVVSTLAAWFAISFIFSLWSSGTWVFETLGISLLAFAPAAVLVSLIGAMWRVYRIKRGHFGHSDIDPDLFS